MPGRQAIARWLRVAFGLGLLAFLLTRVELAEYRGFLERGDPGELTLGLGLLLLAFPVLQALRLHPLVARYTGSVATTFSVFMVGAFFNTMLPSNVGGDAVRLLYLRKLRADNWGGPFAMLMLHRAAGMGVLLLAAVVHALVAHEHLAAVLSEVALAPLPGKALLAAAAAAVAVGALGLFAIARSAHPLARKARGFAADCMQAVTQVGALATAQLLLLTALFHLVRMFAFLVLIRYMGQDIALFDLLPVLTATALAGVVPLTIGGLGLMEGAISVTLGLFGVSAAASIGVAVANRLVLVLSALAGGVVYVATGGPTLRAEARSHGGEDAARAPSP